MEIIRTLLVVLEAGLCLGLIGLILLQKSKNDGLGIAFGGAGNDSLLGAQAGNVLTKATIIVGCMFLLNTLVLGMMFSGGSEQSLMDKVEVPSSAPTPSPDVNIPQQTPNVTIPQQAPSANIPTEAPAAGVPASAPVVKVPAGEVPAAPSE